jgi:hypothetical protein
MEDNSLMWRSIIFKPNSCSSFWKSWRHGELISTFRAFRLFTMHNGRTSGTSKDPTVTYIKSKSTFRTTNYMFIPLFHRAAPSTRKTRNQILKMLLVKTAVSCENLNSSSTVNTTQNCENLTTQLHPGKLCQNR